MEGRSTSTSQAGTTRRTTQGDDAVDSPSPPLPLGHLAILSTVNRFNVPGEGGLRGQAVGVKDQNQVLRLVTSVFTC